ncbi:hypothetical protein AB0N18_18275 [Streptomyces griseoincarnatus]
MIKQLFRASYDGGAAIGQRTITSLGHHCLFLLAESLPEADRQA